MSPDRFAAISTSGLGAALAWGILTLWIPERWPLSVVQIVLFALAAAWLLLSAAGRVRLISHPLLIALAAAPIWGLVQLAFGRTVYRWETWIAVLDWTARLVVAFVAVQSLARAELRDRFLRAVFLFGLVLGVVSVLQMFTSGGRVFWRFESGFSSFVLGPFVYKNQFAAFLEPVLALAMVAALRNPARGVAHACATAVLFACAIASASRAGCVLCAALLIAIPATAAARGILSRRAMAQVMAIVALAAVLFTAVVGWDTLWKRLLQPDPLALRREMFQSSVDMVRGRPLFGFGLGTWSTAYPAYARFDNGTFVNQAHNDWVQWAAEGGVPFLGLMLAVVAMLVRPAADSLWGIGLLAVFVHCAFDYPMQQRPALAIFFFALAGALAAHHRGGR
jgi:O-antigen ligase